MIFFVPPQQLELFDELEEWRLIQEHYMGVVCVRRSRRRRDYHPFSELVDYWENHVDAATMPRFQTEQVRKSTHLELVQKVAVQMYTDKERLGSQSVGSAVGRLTLDAVGIQRWLRRPSPFMESSNSAPDLLGKCSNSSLSGE